MTSTASTGRHRAASLGGRTRVLVLVAAVAAAVVLNTLISTAAHALGASADFTPLQPAAYIFLTVVGVIAGTAGWAVIRARTRHPARVLRWVVPVVLAVSFVPDGGLLVLRTWPGTSGLAVGALVLMHVAVAAVTVSALVRALPLSDR
ncbi:DUF6069 family protein [uncultured Friedmanniella sp.]|uniref:DUF6069 family protein n=1 Tax=uncultured Friedmanniella sp. TaxID=335381 RepID=UPI0035CB8CD1